MTFYKLLGSRTLKDREEKADYLDSDLRWTEDLEEKFDFDSRLADRVCDEMDRIRESRLQNQI